MLGRVKKGGFLQKLDDLINQLNELKTGLVNQIDGFHQSSAKKGKSILEKRKALLKLELNLQKLKALKLKQKSKRP